MGRFILAILLATSLLVCPLRCYSCQTGVALDVDRAVTACPCCHDSGNSGKTEIPADAPSEDCSCPNCICEGATIQAGPEIPDHVPQLVCFVDWSVLVNGDVLRTTVQRSRSAGKSPPCSLYGRDALIAHQSWLI